VILHKQETGTGEGPHDFQVEYVLVMQLHKK